MIMSTMESENHDRELFEIRNIMQFLDGLINFKLYEALFQTMCYSPRVENNWSLRVNTKSINKGLRRWYGGKDNLALAYLLYNFIAKGKYNHQVTFSEFISVNRDISLVKIHVKLFIFNVITAG